MRSIRILFCLVMLLFICTLHVWCIDKTKSIEVVGDSALSMIGKPGFMPVYLLQMQLARELNDTVQIEKAYANVISHYYELGNTDSLKIVSYDYMKWCEVRGKEIARYQTWRQYVQRLTEKGMQKEAIAETELLRKDAEKNKSKYGQACSEMCIGYNHRVFSNNVQLCIDYYTNALKLFEASAYYDDVYVVYLNIVQIYLSRQEYVKATETLKSLEQLTAAMDARKIKISRNLLLRFYQFRVIVTLADKGEKAAEKYIREADKYYFMYPDCVSKDVWYGYKILCSRTLKDWEETLVYIDSLNNYHISVGSCYPANYLFKAQCLEALGRFEESCRVYAEYAQINDSVRTVERDDQLSKYTIQFEVDKLKMEQLEQSAKSNRDRLILSLVGGSIIFILLLILCYYYSRSLVMNKKLNVANKAVIKASKIKSSFIQHITHEIRTPLNSIVGFASLIAAGGLDKEEESEYSRHIENNNMYLLDLVSNIIDIADMDSQTDDMPKKTVDVNACCEEAIADIRPILKESIDLQYISSPEPLVIQAVYPWVKRVLVSLLNNANKFTDTGVIRLKCEGDKQRRLVRFIIEDTGCGIAEEYKDSIFERFVKVDSFTPGTGLGLSIVQQIMDIVDGKVYLDTSYSGGARFVVEWPA